LSKRIYKKNFLFFEFFTNLGLKKFIFSEISIRKIIWIIKYLIDLILHKKKIESIIFADNLITKKERTMIDRWKFHRKALFPSFWEHHFSIADMLNSKILNGRIFDFGCGSGNLDIELAKRGFNIYGIDHSKVSINIAKYYKNRQKLNVRKNLRFKCVEIHNFAPNFKFDSGIISHVLEHIKLKEAQLIFTELKRLLKINAKIFIAVPFKKFYWDPDHCNIFYSLTDFNKFISSIGFKIITSEIDYKNKVIKSISSCY